MHHMPFFSFILHLPYIVLVVPVKYFSHSKSTDSLKIAIEQ